MKDLRNRVHLIGNLGKDPEIVDLKGDKKLAKFSVATSQSYTNSNGDWVKDTQWHSIVAWGKLAETTEKYLKKGMEVALEGKLVYRKYDDKEGITRYSTEINLSEYIKISKKEASEAAVEEK